MSAMSVGLHREFRRSLARLSATEKAQVSRMMDMLMAGQQSPGMRAHALQGTDYLSYSSSIDLRALAVRTEEHLTFVYVDHHDRAYRWAKHHPVVRSDDYPILEFLDTELQESDVRAERNQEPAALGMTLSARLTRLGYPANLVSPIRQCSDQGQLLLAIEPLSPEWQEAILDIAKGANIRFESLACGGSSRVKAIRSDEEMQEALRLPLDDWRLFLHPLQKLAVMADPTKPLLVLGGPGTGKSVVLLHRARWLSDRIEASRAIVVLTSGAELIQWMKNEYGKLVCGPPAVSFADKDSLSFEGQDAGTRVSTDGFFTACGSTAPIGHLLIDEAQDLRRREIASVLALATRGIPLTLAFDGNQAMHHTQSFKLLRKLDTKLNALETIHLTYTYRLTRQVVEVVSRYGKHLHQSHEVLERPGRATALALSSRDLLPVQNALTGPKPRLITAKDAQGIGVLAEKIVRRWLHEDGYSKNEVAVVMMPGYANAELSSALHRRGLIAPLLRNPTQLKGLEFFAGLVLGCDGFLQDEALETFLLHPGQVVSIKTEHALRLNCLYVALSRFRNQVVVIVTAGSPLKPFMKQIIDGSKAAE